MTSFTTWPLLHQAQEPFLRSPPDQSALDEAAHEQLEMRARETLTLGDRHCGKAQSEIRADDIAPRRDQEERQRAGQGADRGLHAERQPVH